MLARLLPLAALFPLCWMAPKLVAPKAWPATAASMRALRASIRSHAELHSADSALYLEMQSGSALLHEGLEHPFVRALQRGGAFAPFVQGSSGSASSEPAPWQQLEGWLGQDPLEFLNHCADDGLSLSVQPAEEGPRWSIALRGKRDRDQRAALEQALTQAAAKAGFPDAFHSPTEHRGGWDLWQVGPGLAIAQRETWLVLGPSRTELRERLTDRGTRDSGDLERNAAFRENYDARNTGSQFWVWANLEALRSADSSGGSQADAEVWSALARMAREPAPQFLLGSALSLAGGARSWTLELDLEDANLVARLAAVGIDGELADLLPVQTGAPRLPARHPRDLLRANLCRDLTTLFQERTALFAPREQPGLAEAESNLALFFGGADIVQEVLPGFSPWWGVIVREIEFDANATPDARLPAVALTCNLQNVDGPSGSTGPKQNGADVISAFQSAIGIVNVERAQMGERAMQLELRALDSGTLSLARYRAPAEGQHVDLRYNLEPACTLVGDTLVLGTHAALVAEVALELHSQQESGEPSEELRRQGRESLILEGPALADWIELHRELLVTRAVLEDGISHDEAQGQQRYLAALLRTLESLELQVQRRDPAHVELRAALKLTSSNEVRR